MKRVFALAVLATAALAPAVFSQTPLADHHAHLLSPASVKLAAEPPLPSVELPADLARLLLEREKAWNDKTALAPLFTEDSLVFDHREPLWIRGRAEVAEYLGENFAKPYHIIPIAHSVTGSSGYIAGYFTRPLENGTTRYFGQVLMSLQKGADGAWRIAAESPTFPGPRSREPRAAEQLIAERRGRNPARGRSFGRLLVRKPHHAESRGRRIRQRPRGKRLHCQGSRPLP